MLFYALLQFPFFKSFEERKIIPALSIAEISFPFYGDEKAVTRIFENIISNALSHGKVIIIFIL